MPKLCNILKNLNYKLHSFCNSAIKTDLPFEIPLKCLPLTSVICRQKFKNKEHSKSRTNFEGYDTGPSSCLFLEVFGLSTVALVGLQYAVLHNRSKNCLKKPRLRNLLPTHPLIESAENKIISNVLPSFTSTVSKATKGSIPDEVLSVNNAYQSDVIEELPKHWYKEAKNIVDLQPNKDDVCSSSVEIHVQKLEEAGELCSSVVHNDVALELVSHHQHKKALDLFKASCELGSEKACFNAGLCYELGLGTKHDLDKARQFYVMAAAKGHVLAIYNLGVMHMQGKDNSQNVDKAVRLIKMAAQQGLLEANTALGTYFMENQKPAEALPFLEAAAEQGDSSAKFYLGVCYEKGWSVFKDLGKAREFYSQAADKGHTDAAYNLAVFHEFGLGGIPSQKDKALQLYEWARDRGHVPSAFRILHLQHKNPEVEHKKENNRTSSWTSLSDQLKYFLQDENCFYSNAIPVISNSVIEKSLISNKPSCNYNHMKATRVM